MSNVEIKKKREMIRAGGEWRKVVNLQMVRSWKMNKYFHKGKEVSHGIARGGTLSGRRSRKCRGWKDQVWQACLSRYFMINIGSRVGGTEWMERRIIKSQIREVMRMGGYDTLDLVGPSKDFRLYSLKQWAMGEFWVKNINYISFKVPISFCVANKW